MQERCTTKMHKGISMKFLCIISGCPAGARKGRISIFAVLLHSKKQNDPEGSFSVYRKASQSFASADAKDV